MKKRFLPFFISLVFTSLFSSAQGTRIGQHDAIKNWQAPTTNFASLQEGRQIAQQIIDIIGLKPNFEVQVANIPNAAAVVYGGRRYVLYNPSFIDQLTKATGTKWAAISVLAHEIGHHLNGHTITSTGSQPSLELEADEFSGFVLRKMGASLDQAQVAMKVAAQQRASKTHPGQYDRLAAIQKGWSRADGQVNGSTTASTTSKPQQPVTTRPATSTASNHAKPVSASISQRDIIARVNFHADQSNTYYVTSRYNLIRLVNDRISVIGKLGKAGNDQYPYTIYDNNTRLMVNRNGSIYNRQGRVVGTLRAFSQ
jgi:hypothetical protein